MLLFYGGLCVNFDIIGEISHGSNRTHTHVFVQMYTYMLKGMYTCSLHIDFILKMNDINII